MTVGSDNRAGATVAHNVVLLWNTGHGRQRPIMEDCRMPFRSSLPEGRPPDGSEREADPRQLAGEDGWRGGA